MIVISHRGHWLSPVEKNLRPAFDRSFQNGFGTETDVRDSGGRLVISHDPPAGGEVSFEELLTLHRQINTALPLAINIKSDGLQRLMQQAVQHNRPANWFVFDMSVPDTRAWLQSGVPVFVRHSDIEREPCFYDEAAGVWLDGLRDDWFAEKDVAAHLRAGKKVCMVSPELHGRPRERLWSWLAAAKCRSDDNLMLCTDHPLEARATFMAS